MKKFFVLLIIILGAGMFFINTKLHVINTQILKKGEDFSVKLGSNPSTGYGWQFNYNPARIELVDKKTIPSNIPDGLIGASRSHNYVFRGLKKGVSHITAKYVGPWKNSAFFDMKTYTIFVY